MVSQAVLAIGLFSLLSPQSHAAAPLQPIQWPSMTEVIRWQSPWVLEMNAPDPQAAAIVAQYLNNLETMGFPAEVQGVWVQTGSTAIASNQGTMPLPAASLTKLVTTLAALETWPLDHQFETWVGRTGPIRDGVLQGDLVIRWEGDPYFVWEEAIALGNALQQLGLRQVTGDLMILGDFSMNFEDDPYRAGELLIQALDSRRWSTEVWGQYDQMFPNTPQPTLQIDGAVTVRSATAVSDIAGWLIRHESLPLIALLKAMNIYSNNVMSDLLAAGMGGTNTMLLKAAQGADLSLREIRLINGSGLGMENQISPRTVVAVLIALQAQLRAENLSVSDIMPVAGEDVGTLVYRDLPAQSALKTGTLATVSSLAGFFPTRDRGPVWFAIQNQGSDVVLLRAQQDALLAALADHWGVSSAPPHFQSRVRLGVAPYVLGDPTRNLAPN
ncbi:MAG: D-alanyl-D-alanine carboxypeptidase [Leptolyngbyaceae cyanobacterium T60_A2020_046]|nr:D-alanyl-D-alanine carboxypeptidase [Leptolyngbyaceae cyanobacterium T60_A2020_046]